MKKYLVSKCFEVVTEESASFGDFADHGFVFEDVPMTMEEIEQEIKEKGYRESSSMFVPENDDVCREWISTVDPEQSRRYFEKGEGVFYSLHIKEMTNKEFISMCNATEIQVKTC